MVCWVAVGGRGTLYGAVIGAILVNWGATTVSEQWPDTWQYVQGLVFIVVVAFIPGGIVGLVRVIGQRRCAAASATTAAVVPPNRRDRGGTGRDVTDALLTLRGVVVDFDGFKAVDGVDLTIEQGELRFLIGPNGAGKTSLIDVITGLTNAVGGRDHVRRPVDRRRVGGQAGAPRHRPQLPDADRVRLADGRREPRPRRDVPLPAAPAAAAAPRLSDGVVATLERIGLEAQAHRPAGVLSHGQKQWLEIGMLLVQRPKLVLLDEPVAGMSGSERQATGELLEELADGPHRRRDRARHGVPAPLRPLGDRAPRGQDPERGRASTTSRATRGCARCTSAGSRATSAPARVSEARRR